MAGAAGAPSSLTGTVASGVDGLIGARTLVLLGASVSMAVAAGGLVVAEAASGEVAAGALSTSALVADTVPMDAPSLALLAFAAASSAIRRSTCSQ